jgi:UDP-glucose 4-epimerase
MRIVVTGALGHIGSRLIRELPRTLPEARIVMVDNLLTQRYASLFNLPAAGNYRFIEADILVADLVRIFDGADLVIHLAAITNAAGSFDIEEQVERVNIAGTEKVATACARTGTPMIFPSTTSVYGTQSEVVDEDCPRTDLRPQSPYAASKLRSENLLAEIAELRYVILRFGTIFGTSPGMRFHTAVNKFCWQAVNGQPVTVWQNAMDQQRPYLDLADAVEALEFIQRKGLFDRRVYNVLTLNATVAQITKAIAAHVPDLRVETVDSPIVNQFSYCVSSRRFAGLGFEFRGDLERGIGDTVRLLRALANHKAHVAWRAAS